MPLHSEVTLSTSAYLAIWYTFLATLSPLKKMGTKKAKCIQKANEYRSLQYRMCSKNIYTVPYFVHKGGNRDEIMWKKYRF
jgi:hypothetical protein